MTKAEVKVLAFLLGMLILAAICGGPILTYLAPYLDPPTHIGVTR